MSEIPYDGDPIRLTPEVIQEQTGFKLIMVFPDFADSGRISLDLHEERERFSALLGEDRVLPSMYSDEDGKLQLGLFIKEDETFLTGLAEAREVMARGPEAVAEWLAEGDEDTQKLKRKVQERLDEPDRAEP